MAETDLNMRIRVDDADFRRLQQNMANVGATGAAGLGGIERQSDQLGRSIGRSASQAQFLRGVLEAFLLYKGFVFLKTQVEEFTRELVNLQHEVGIVQTQLSGLGVDFRRRITSEVINTARETGLAMDALAKAEFEVVSANIDVESSFGILNLAAKAAVAGGLSDVTLAFNSALSQVKAFGLGLTEFDEVFDKQFNLVKRGIFTYEQFATVVGSVSEAFGSMGQDIDTANAALAAISQVFTGKQLERGATGLRNAVLRLGEGQEEFEALGVAVVDANGNFRDFIDIGRDLKVVLDGLSESARARVVKDLFPDERERRGINAFLLQLDQAEQFFIEQKFSAGALNEAFETVNESLLTQARILRAELIPAFEPFVAMIGSLASAVNNLNEAVPGLTRSLIQFGAVAGVIGGVALLGGGRLFGAGGSMALRQQPLALPGLVDMFGRQGVANMGGFSRFPVRPTAFGGIGGAAIGGVLPFTSGATGGFSIGGLLGSAGAGAATGAFLGGAPGAAIGAAASAIAFSLGSAFADRADEPAETFASAFTRELEARSGDVAESFRQALLAAPVEDRGTLPSLLAAVAQTGRRPLSVSDIQSAPASVRQAAAFAESPAARAGMSPLEGAVGLQNQLRAFDREAAIAIEAGLRSQDELDKAREGLISTFLDANFSLENLTGALRDEEIARRELVEILASGNMTQAEMAQALSILTNTAISESERLIEFGRFIRESSGEILTGLSKTLTEASAVLEQDFNLAANVFGRIEGAGDSLAESFRGLAQASRVLAIAQTLRETTLPDPRIDPLIETFRARREQLRGSNRPADIRAAEAMSRRIEKLEGMRDRNIIDQFVVGGESAFNEALAQFFAEALGITPGQRVGPRELLEAIIGEAGQEAIVEEISIGATSLADGLMSAAEALRFGLIDPMGFTADQLEMMGEELQAFNRLVFQRRILEEIQGLADFAGLGDQGLGPAFEAFREGMVEAVGNFINTMGDPAKLAELLANLEFGDVEIDNSTNQNIVIRVSGDVGESQIRAIEQAVIAGLNQAARRSS